MTLNSQTLDLLDLGVSAPSRGFLFSMSPMQHAALLDLPTDQRAQLVNSMVAVYRSRWTDVEALRQVIEQADAALASNQVITTLHKALRDYAEQKRFPDLPFMGAAEVTFSYAALDGHSAGEQKFHDQPVRIYDVPDSVGALSFAVILVKPLPEATDRPGLYYARVNIADGTSLQGRITEYTPGMTGFVMQEDARV